MLKLFQSIFGGGEEGRYPESLKSNLYRCQSHVSENPCLMYPGYFLHTFQFYDNLAINQKIDSLTLCP